MYTDWRVMDGFIFNIPEEFKNSSGIYLIQNTVNGKVYVGKTVNFYRRWQAYKYAVRAGNVRKINEYFLNAIKKHGDKNFTFSMLEVCSVEDLAERELFWMLEYSSTDNAVGYNLRMDSSTGMITHEDTSKKISARLKKEWETGVRSKHAEKITRNLFIIYDPDGYECEVLGLKDLQNSLFSRCVSRISIKGVRYVPLGDGAYVEKIPIEEYLELVNRRNTLKVEVDF